VWGKGEVRNFGDWFSGEVNFWWWLLEVRDVRELLGIGRGAL
jgi:hypothetical protein